MIAPADGYYWARFGLQGEPFIIQKAGACWHTMGSEDDYTSFPRRDDFVPDGLVLLAGPLPAPAGATIAAEANFCWNGSEVSAELTCGHCGHVELYDIWVDDLIECRKCLRIWRPTRVVSCNLVTEEAEIAEFRRRYHGAPQ